MIDKEIAEESIQKKALSVDESMYYDMLSAFCKSLRGSDADAAVYWAIRLIESGCDPMLIARRLIAHSAEDVGMADPLAQLMALNPTTKQMWIFITFNFFQFKVCISQIHWHIVILRFIDQFHSFIQCVDNAV